MGHGPLLAPQEQPARGPPGGQDVDGDATPYAGRSVKIEGFRQAPAPNAQQLRAEVAARPLAPASLMRVIVCGQRLPRPRARAFDWHGRCFVTRSKVRLVVEAPKEGA